MLIPKQVFKVSKLAAREPTRWYAIHGIRVKRRADGKCIAVATDGRRLIEVTWDDEHLRPEFAAEQRRAKRPCTSLGSVEPVKGFETIVSQSQWDEARKAIPNVRDKPILKHCLLDETSVEGKVQMEITTLGGKRPIEGDSIEGDFPYEDLIPKYTVGKDAVEISVNPKLLAEVLNAIKAVTKNEESEVVRLIVPANPTRPMVIEGRTPEGIKARAVLMPTSLETGEKR